MGGCGFCTGQVNDTASFCASQQGTCAAVDWLDAGQSTSQCNFNTLLSCPQTNNCFDCANNLNNCQWCPASNTCFASNDTTATCAENFIDIPTTCNPASAVVVSTVVMGLMAVFYL